MEIATINTLRELRDAIRESVKSINASQFTGQTFGSENEYSVKGLIGGVKGLLTDLSTLTGAPLKFVKFSNYTERNTLVTHFTQLRNQLNANQFAQVAATIDAIKPLIRGFNVRHSFERLNEFDTHIDKLQAKATSMEQLLATVEEAKLAVESKVEELSELEGSQQERLESLNKQATELESLLQNTEFHRENSEGLFEKDKENSKLIEDHLKEVETNKKVVDSFSKRVTQREGQLDKQEVRTESYDEKLESYRLEQEAYLLKAHGMIESAKTALEYKTAEGLSAAFITKHDEAKEDKTTLYWILGSLAFFLGAIGIGIAILWGGSTGTEILIGRISLIPLMIAGAWFCTGQYVKQKNLIEDYAYKSVLAKSIVGFSEQLSSGHKGEEYSHYIQTVLGEIHNDPLLKNIKAKKGGDIISDANELVDELKGMIKSLKASKFDTDN